MGNFEHIKENTIDATQKPCEVTNSYITAKNQLIPDRTEIKDVCVELIQLNEGYKPNAYWDNKRYSIGFGTKSKQGETITRDEAVKRLREHLNEHVYKYIPDNVSDSTFLALCDLGYNMGPSAIIKSVNEDGTLNFEQYQKYVYIGSGKSEGLEQRRQRTLIISLGLENLNQ